MLAICWMVMETPEERELFSILYNEHRQFLFHEANRILHQAMDAEDAVQEAFIKIAFRMSSIRIDDPRSVSTRAFLKVVVANTAKDMLRARKRKQEREQSMDDEEMTWSETDIRKISREEEEEILNRLDQEQMIQAMQTLPESTRDILYLSLVQGLSVKDTAYLLGLSPDAARKRIARGSRALWQALKKENEGDERG